MGKIANGRVGGFRTNLETLLRCARVATSITPVNVVDEGIFISRGNDYNRPIYGSSSPSNRAVVMTQNQFQEGNSNSSNEFVYAR